MTSFQVPYPEIGRCMCGAVLRIDSFRDDAAYQAFFRTGLCQGCSDASSFAQSRQESSLRFPVRRGALVTASRDSEAALEWVVFPFVFVVPEPRIAWEARFILRIGPDLEPLDHFDELLPMKDLLCGHQIRVQEASSLVQLSGAAELVARLELIIAPDKETLDTVAGGGAFPDDVLRLALSDALAWRKDYGRALVPLERWWPFDSGPVSVLRACGLLGLALAVPGSRSGVTSPISRLLSSCRDAFPESAPVPTCAAEDGD